MINLACKNITIEELIKCSFNINKTEFLIIKILLDDENCSSDSLHKRLGKDLSTVQKALKTLVEKGLVVRYQVNLDGGGYKYYYKSISKDDIRSRVLGSLRNFEEKVLFRLNNF